MWHAITKLITGQIYKKNKVISHLLKVISFWFLEFQL